MESRPAPRVVINLVRALCSSRGGWRSRQVQARWERTVEACCPIDVWTVDECLAARLTFSAVDRALRAGALHDVRDIVVRFLRHPQAETSADRNQALSVLGVVLLVLGSPEEGRAHLQKVLDDSSETLTARRKRVRSVLIQTLSPLDPTASVAPELRKFVSDFLASWPALQGRRRRLDSVVTNRDLIRLLTPVQRRYRQPALITDLINQLDVDPLDQPPVDWPAETFHLASNFTEWSLALPGAVRCIGGPHTARNPTVCSAGLLVSVSNPGYLARVNPDTQTIDWSVSADYLLDSRVAVNEGFILSGLPSALMAIRIQDGHVAWRFRPRNAGPEAFYARPLLVDDRVYISDRDGDLFCLDLTSGRRHWKRRVSPGRFSANASPEFIGGHVVVGTNAGELVACDPFTGRVAWRNQPVQLAIRSLLTEGTSVVAVSEQGLAWIETQSGATVRTYTPVGETVLAAVITPHGPVVVLRRPAGVPRIALLDGDGCEQWSLDFHPHAMPNLSYDAELDLIYEATYQGLGFVCPRTGRRLAVFYRRLGEGYFDQPPSRIGHRLYAVDFKGHLLCLTMPEALMERRNTVK